MTVQEVADALNLTRRNVRKLQVPFYAVGRSPIYARKDLEEAGLIEPRPEPPKPPVIASWVYFIVAGKKVKIGTAKNPLKRHASLQCGSPVPLRLMAQTPGDTRLERELHDRWDAHRLHGEWFRLVPEIVAFIREVKVKRSSTPLE
jgi:hypothetical protein